MQVLTSRDAKFFSHAFAFGSRVARSDANAVMGGENSEVTLNGLYLGRGEQIIDNHTSMDHAVPHCRSYEIYSGILDGRSRGVFNGKIFVRIDAQKTDAKQTNRALLLSREAEIDTKPQLEIFADDVKCTHGATIGQLDENALFYLRARGIAESDARDILIAAFASDILNNVKVEPLRARLQKELLARLRRTID
jgi:Fe-S cluster assembly protein SufD